MGHGPRGDSGVVGGVAIMGWGSSGIGTGAVLGWGQFRNRDGDGGGSNYGMRRGQFWDGERTGLGQGWGEGAVLGGDGTGGQLWDGEWLVLGWGSRGQHGDRDGEGGQHGDRVGGVLGRGWGGGTVVGWGRGRGQLGGEQSSSMAAVASGCPGLVPMSRLVVGTVGGQQGQQWSARQCHCLLPNLPPAPLLGSPKQGHPTGSQPRSPLLPPTGRAGPHHHPAPSHSLFGTYWDTPPPMSPSRQAPASHLSCCLSP